MSSKIQQIEKIANQIKKCRKCRLWKTGKAVPGEGSVNAKIMFIGEAPGKEESETGRPFVGRAGKFLDLLLKEIGIERKKIFITSVIKHRPPKNRQPKKDELEACQNWWQKQIEIIKPKIIVLLGNVAFNTVIGEKKAKDYRGKFFKKGSAKYFLTYHPAAALRFPPLRKEIEKDFQKIKKYG